MRAALALLCAAALSPAPVRASSLDVTAAYRMKGLSYTNLELGRDPRSKDNRSYLANDARLGVAVRRIPLASGRGEDASMDVGLVLHAVGVAGSTDSFHPPFDRIANVYPNAELAPFIENAYVRVSRLWGYAAEWTFGRQSFRLGSGLLLDDDGTGFTGASVRAELPWWGLKGEAFGFQDKSPFTGRPLELAGVSIALPTEGTWEVSQLFERDRAEQLIYGCTYPGDPDLNGCRVSRALRSFSSLRYQISFGPMVFDGEAALQRGAATPTGPQPAGNHVTFNGNAQVVRMKWKQGLYKTGEGIARVVVGRGSGDDPGTPTRDEAFFPSRGHRVSGLERSGFGEFFGATPYEAFGGNYSTSTKSGLPQTASGVMIVGAGYTTPAYRGFTFDLDFFLFQAERIQSGPRTLGTEWDARLRYPIRDQFTIALTGAQFRAGKALDPGRASARKYGLEVSGRF